MHNFKDLKVWQKAIELATSIYQVARSFPREEKFGLTSQMRRASVSIPSNIAEGSARTSKKAFANSLEISLGESFELETQLEIAKRIGFLNEEQINNLTASVSEIQKMLVCLKSSLDLRS